MVALAQTALRHVPDVVESEFASDVIAGLSARPKQLSPKYFYDELGAQLFEEITRLPEYYPTRTETALLEAYGSEIAALAGTGRVLVEFGSGSSRKTSLLLSALEDVSAYIPIDIAAESLQEAAAWLKGQHPSLTILPLIADFTATRALPQAAAA